MDTLVAAIIEGDAGEFLMVRNPDGRWGFPAGSRRPTESYEAAMRRVARDSLGIELDIHTGQPPLAGEYLGRPSVLRFFLGGILDGEAKALGYPEIRWMAPADARREAFEPLVQRILDWYLEGLN